MTLQLQYKVSSTGEGKVAATVDVCGDDD